MPARKVMIVAGGAVALILTLADVFYARWAVDFITNWSDDIMVNSMHLMGVVGLLGAACIVEGLLVREAWHWYRGLTGPKVEVDEAVLAILEDRPKDRRGQLEARRKRLDRQMRETWTLWLVFLLAPFVVNALVLNSFTGGYILSGQRGLSRYATVATLLRSKDPADQYSGIDDAAGLTDRGLGRYLASIIAARGSQAGFAAWAAASRGDDEAVVPIRWLFLKGDMEQRRVAVVSLARLADLRGAVLAEAALERGEEPRLECIIALGLMAHEPAEDLLEALGGNLEEPEILRAAAFWAIYQIERARFNKAVAAQASPDLTPGTMKVPERKGWKPMVAALGSSSPLMRCAAVQGLACAGPVETAADVMKAFEASGHLDKCQSLTVQGMKSTRYSIVREGLFRSLAIDSLALIGNRQIISWLEGQASDRKNADEVILKAKDLARQIRQLR